jgi:hypothetical protein
MNPYLTALLCISVLASSTGCKKKNGKAKNVKAEMVGTPETTDKKEYNGISFKSLSAIYPALNTPYSTCNLKYRWCMKTLASEYPLM